MLRLICISHAVLAWVGSPRAHTRCAAPHRASRVESALTEALGSSALGRRAIVVCGEGGAVRTAELARGLLACGATCVAPVLLSPPSADAATWPLRLRLLRFSHPELVRRLGYEVGESACAQPVYPDTNARARRQTKDDPFLPRDIADSSPNYVTERLRFPKVVPVTDDAAPLATVLREAIEADDGSDGGVVALSCFTLSETGESDDGMRAAHSEMERLARAALEQAFGSWRPLGEDFADVQIAIAS